MKQSMLITAPASSLSGYGAHSRSLIWSLFDSNKYDIKINDVRWGNTPRNYLKPNNSRHQLILDSILKEPKLDRQPDLYVDIRIPQEFETHGKFSIGITAGIETTSVSAKWLEGCNRMDLIIVPSEHSRSGFINSVYDAFQNFPDGSQQPAGSLKLTTPIEVVFEGIDTKIFEPLAIKDINKKILKLVNSTIKEDFAFLFVGQWVKGGYGEDRKDIGKLIKIFCETFANKSKQPALILKTSGATFSLLDQNEIIGKINHIRKKFPQQWKLPSIYLLHGSLTDEEINHLYNHPKIKTMISFTHGEGFGRPLLEASMVGLPVIAPAWSGHLDFLSPEQTIFVNGKLEQVPKAAVWEDIVIPESKWFVIDEHHAYKALTYAFENKYEIKERAKAMMEKNRKKYSLTAMTDLLNATIEKHAKGKLATSVPLKLPKLQKIEEPKEPEQIKLPKLTKVT